jgi:MtfA peptidase
MDVHALAFYIFSALGVALALALLGWPRWVAWQRQRVAAQVFPLQWRKVLRRRVPLVRRLPVPLQLQLKKHMQVFIAEKPIIGCAGLRVSDEMRVVIAAQACLLVLNRSTDYFPNLRQILLYSGAFAVDRASTNDAGVQQEQRQAMAGESWSQGQVILSWQDCLEGAARSDDGRNVVIHEFAHQLDQENGVANGAPPPSLGVGGTARYSAQRWSQVFHAAYAQLQAQAHTGVQGLLSHYGAQDPAEFFAVVSEAFFEQGAALLAQYPALYAELAGFYQVDSAAW